MIGGVIMASMEYENKYYNEGYNVIVGMDEAGRGPLAGPLVIACVILEKGYENELINDSKKLSEKKRELLYEEIQKVATYIGVKVIDEATIDKLNIYAATKKGMEDLIREIPFKVDVVLVDAMKIELKDMIVNPLIHGDALSTSIAAASIIAKVTRDRMMYEIDKEFPMYDFKSNKGYGTKKHMEAIDTYGICKYHRLSYYPVSKYAQLKLDI
jgi:ribonuclease HII